MNRGDRWLVVLPVALTLIGVIMVYSSSAILGITRYQDPDHYFVKQAVRAGLGLVGFWLCSRVPLRWLESSARLLLVVAVGLLLAVIVLGKISNGAMRWLPLGPIQIQPTDVARVVMVIFLAAWLKLRPPAELGFARGTVPPLVLVGFLAALVLLQPNLSSAALLGMVGLGLVFLAGAPLRHFAVPAAAGVAGVAIALATHPYMMGRVETFLRFVMTGTLDARGAGWQLDQSLIAIGSGGWLGRGLGAGLSKYLFLPEAHTDFIFSILAEELGFFGTTGLITLFALYVWRGLRVAARAEDPFLHLLAAGLTLQIALYACVNLAVATGVAPTTGLPLPFVSYGGSALLLNLAAAGLLYRVSVATGSADAVARRRFAEAS